MIDASQPNAPAPGGKPAPARRGAYPLFRAIPTRWMDNDVYGHVNNVVYYSFFDSVVNATLIEHGLLDPGAGDVIGLVVESGCRYAASLQFPETIEAGLRVAQLGRSSVRYEIALFRQGHDAAAAEGFFVHVYVDRLARRPTALPQQLRAFLETLQPPA
ncbi:thioesterase family protein [Novosphingobium olei]|uniref:acyl-CoA thioesterase n=1 Tax=Novosphingobium olei TaxID=2728851 RepID=UPI003090B96F|nr:acyl-CoA thioesterase [Novosphingobium olei]